MSTIPSSTVPIAVDRVSQALSGFSSALKEPVHIVGLLLLAVLAFELGRIAMEGWRRVRPGAPPLEQIASRAMADATQAGALARWAPGPLAERAVLGLAAAVQSGGRDAIENALASFELQIQRRLDRTRVLVRAGPAVGLMGTLIPLAPGLAALGKGNYTQLAGDLQVAFAATVVGILVGTGAFTLTLMRTRVYTEDLAALERAVASREPQAQPHHRVAAAVGEHAT
ncbi:MAG TPA: MotA/TolQ/ExbB proton channel family protein [Solirubrobacteraceae bacterium]|nr:MotA/TolQ/ExbB proton channel family protein [Solirubrobacteraceae bacterium]